MHPSQASRKAERFFQGEDAELHAPPRNDAPHGDIAEADIRAALERLLRDKRLHMSERNRRFLRFVVEEKLAGRAERIKSYTVAVDVFGRAPTFDGLIDPIVRIEATRMRAALDAFYQEHGFADPIVIDVPKGGYVPEFRLREPLSSAPAILPFETRSSEPSIRNLSIRQALFIGTLSGVILCFAVLAIYRPWQAGSDAEVPIMALEPVRSIPGTGGENELAQGLTQTIISDVSRLPGVRLVHLRDGLTSPDPLATAGKAPVYRMESSLRMSEDALRFWWSMIDARSGRTLWSETVDQPRLGEPDSTVEDEIAARVAMRIAESHEIFGAESSRAGSRDPVMPAFRTRFFADE
jgi:TolB-like protein